MVRILKGIGVLDCSFFGLQDVDGILHRWPAEGPSLKVPIFCDNVPVPATSTLNTSVGTSRQVQVTAQGSVYNFAFTPELESLCCQGYENATFIKVACTGQGVSFSGPAGVRVFMKQDGRS